MRVIWHDVVVDPTPFTPSRINPMRFRVGLLSAVGLCVRLVEFLLASPRLESA